MSWMSASVIGIIVGERRIISLKWVGSGFAVMTVGTGKSVLGYIIGPMVARNRCVHQ